MPIVKKPFDGDRYAMVFDFGIDGCSSVRACPKRFA
jgi:hypothetical protein